MKTSDDSRPPVWVGHVVLETDSLDETEAFMKALGMRPIAKDASVVVLELRGGTHLVLLKQAEHSPGEAPFDLMVDDLDATHRQLTELGASPSAIQQGRIHRSFKVKEPSGQTITINDTHVSGEPV